MDVEKWCNRILYKRLELSSDCVERTKNERYEICEGLVIVCKELVLLCLRFNSFLKRLFTPCYDIINRLVLDSRKYTDFGPKL